MRMVNDVLISQKNLCFLTVKVIFNKYKVNQLFKKFEHVMRIITEKIRTFLSENFRGGIITCQVMKM